MHKVIDKIFESKILHFTDKDITSERLSEPFLRPYNHL